MGLRWLLSQTEFLFHLHICKKQINSKNSPKQTFGEGCCLEITSLSGIKAVAWQLNYKAIELMMGPG